MKRPFALRVLLSSVLVIAAATILTCDANWFAIFGPADVVMRSGNPVLLHDFRFSGDAADATGAAVATYETSDIEYVVDSTGGTAAGLAFVGPPDAVRALDGRDVAFSLQYEVGTDGRGYTVAIWLEPVDISVGDSIDALFALGRGRIEIVPTVSDEFDGRFPFDPDRDLMIVEVDFGLWGADGTQEPRLSVSSRYAGGGLYENRAFAVSLPATHVVVTVDDRNTATLYVNGVRAEVMPGLAGAPAHADAAYFTVAHGVDQYEAGGRSNAIVLQAQIYSEALTGSEIRDLHGRGPE